MQEQLVGPGSTCSLEKLGRLCMLLLIVLKNTKLSRMYICAVIHGVPQFAGLFGGPRMTAASIEWGLSKFGVLKSELEENPLGERRGINITRNAKTGVR